MANNTVDYSKYEKNNETKVFNLYLEKEHALQLISEEEYNMLLELASRTMPEDNYEEDMDKEN